MIDPQEIKILLLCSSRFALAAMRDMVFAKKLSLIAIPRHCDEMIEEVNILLAGTGIPVLILDKDNFESILIKAVKEHSINLGFVMTFSYKISSNLSNSFSKGIFNVHPGPLPEYRGADPIFQQIRNRDQQVGVTIHRLAEKMDAGPVVNREMIRSDLKDTYGLLNLKLAELAAKLTGTVTRMAELDLEIPSRPQDESRARYFKRQSSKDITINWESMDAGSIIALVNACNPWNKGAVTQLKHKIIRILQVEKTMEENYRDQIITPGIIQSISETGIIVSTLKNGEISIGFVYIDEGFMIAGRLADLGFFPGDKFITIG